MVNREAPALDRGKWVGCRNAAIQLTTDCQHGVTNGLGIQPAARIAPVPAIVRVLPQIVLLVDTIQLVGPRLHDQPVKVFYGPARINKFCCDPVKQLGVGRRISPGSKITWRVDNSFPEVPLPDAVDEHACCQRVGIPGQPLGKLPSPASTTVGRDQVTAENLEEATGNYVLIAGAGAMDERGEVVSSQGELSLRFDHQLLDHFADEALFVCASGRPRCPLCGAAINEDETQ